MGCFFLLVNAQADAPPPRPTHAATVVPLHVIFSLTSSKQTGNSNGRLSLRELRSADEARRFYADERARARAETTAGDHRDAAESATGTVLASGEKAPSSTDSSRTSSRRGDHRRVRNGGRAATSSDKKRRGSRAAAPAAAGATEGGGRGRHGDDPLRRGPEEGRLRLRGDQGSLVNSDGETAAAKSPAASPASPPPSPRRSGGERWGREARNRSQEEASGDASSSSCGTPAAGKPGSEEEGAAGEASGVMPTESGSLFELRDALRSREKELLRLKRDVSVVASSAGGFKHLAASLGSSDTNTTTTNNNNTGAGRSSFAFDRHHRGGAEDGDRSGSRQGTPGASYLIDPGELGRADRGSGSGGAGGGLLPPGHSVDSSFAGTSASLLTTASTEPHQPPLPTDSPRRMMPPPPPRRRQQRPQHLTGVSGGAAPAAVSGSPLVASAHEGLRQMRAVLEQRAIDVERAKDDSKNLVSRSARPPLSATRLRSTLFCFCFFPLQLLHTANCFVHILGVWSNLKHNPAEFASSYICPLLSAVVPDYFPAEPPFPLFASIFSNPAAHPPSPKTASLNDVSARLRRSERKRAAQATELAEARAAADAAKSELSHALARHRAKEKAAAAAAAAAAQEDKKKQSEAAAREKAGLLADPAQQRQLRERDAEISRLRDRLEAAAGELSEEQVCACGSHEVFSSAWLKARSVQRVVESAVMCVVVPCPFIDRRCL